MASRNVSYKGKKKIPYAPYGWFPGVLLPLDLIQSDAYKALEHAEHDVLTDLVRIAGAAKGEAFFFTWGQCRIHTTEKVFNKARNKFCKIGFIDRRLDLKELKSGADLYTVSSTWRTYKCKSTGSELRKANRIKRLRDRRKRLFSKTKSAHLEGGEGLQPDGGVGAATKP